MTRSELQALCKRRGLKANSKTAVLRAELRLPPAEGGAAR
jgi:hypothetical protein